MALKRRPSAKRRRKPAPRTGFAAFKASLTASAPPTGLAPAVEALWYAANGYWERAHDAAQKRDDAAGAWVHAYLHRIEGDEGNARYWYGRAGRKPSTAPHGKEWEEIAKALLARCFLVIRPASSDWRRARGASAPPPS